MTVKVSDSELSLRDGGEIGQLALTMHSTSDGRGLKSSKVAFISGYYEPGKDTYISGEQERLNT